MESEKTGGRSATGSERMNGNRNEQESRKYTNYVYSALYDIGGEAPAKTAKKREEEDRPKRIKRRKQIKVKDRGRLR